MGPTESEVVSDLMDAQADLQTALGFVRLNMVHEHSVHPQYIEARLAKSLEGLHGLLSKFGVEMAKGTLDVA